MLSLCQGHAITGNDDDILCFGEHISSCLLGNRLLSGNSHFLFLLYLYFFLHGISALLDRGLTTQKDTHQTAVHRLTHNLCEQQTGSAYDTTYGNEEDIADSHTGDSTSHTRQGVEQGYRDRHIGATHTDGEEDAEETRGNDTCHNEHGHVRVPYAGEHQSYGQQQEDNRIERMVRQDNRLLRQYPVQFSCGYQTTYQGDRTYGNGQHRRELHERHIAGCRHLCLLLSTEAQHRGREYSHQSRGTTTQSVEQSNHLRHLYHLDTLGHHGSDQRTDDNGRVDGPSAQHPTI